MFLGPELVTVLLGLASGATWGAGDFSGGLAARRHDVFGVIVVSQGAGTLALLVIAMLWPEPRPPLPDLALGAAAGIAGALGLAALYRGLATRAMGLMAPMSAVVAALLPIPVAAWRDGAPPATAAAGLGLALVAIWLLSAGDGGVLRRVHDLVLPLAAGAAFALFFILIDQVSERAVWLPLIAARVASILAFGSLVLGQQRPWPVGRHLPLVLLAGVFDVGGNAFFALAARAGRLDIAAMLGSLYPATTVLLAWLLLRERLDQRQWAGVAVALGAVILIAA